MPQEAARRGYHKSLPKRQLSEGRNDLRFAAGREEMHEIGGFPKAFSSHRAKETDQRGPDKHELAFPNPETFDQPDL